MNILVIGGSGVISTSVAQALIDRGEKPTLLNRGQTPVRLQGNFQHLRGDRLIQDWKQLRPEIPRLRSE